MTEITMAGDLIVMSVIAILITTILLIAIKVLSNSRSQDTNDGGGGDVPIIPDTSSIATTTTASSSSSSESWKYDVFLSFRGEDTRKTFVDHLYSALQQHGIITFKDDVTLDRGDTISSSLLKAIQQSQIALVIFSENYADSSWCLDELSHIMECKKKEESQIVMPIFYNVDPSDVRKQKGKFGKSFAKHNNKKKVESWKQALVDSSNIVGWEPKHVANGHEAKCIKEIVDSILVKLQSLDSTVEDEDLVGMGTRLEQLKSQLGIELGGVRMVGIWGLGGGGKTTLANSLYLQISTNFDGCCFLGNIREESSKHGLAKLQEKILFAVFNQEIQVQSVELGKSKIRGMLYRRKVLIVLDDVDHLDQLEALAGSSKWFGDGSRIIITTRDEHLLTAQSRVKYVSPVTLLSYEEAIRLFKISAYDENNPVKDYEKLSKQIVSYAGGLPLALIVLGSFLYDKDNDEWKGTLCRLKDHPEMDIIGKLRISYDRLTPVEKEIFLDIACFYRGRMKDDAMEILDACGFYPAIGVKVLIQKALITVNSYGYFDMHDLVQEMGHYIVKEKHPNNFEKQSRLWRTEDIEDICSRNATTENDKIEAIQLNDYRLLLPSNFVMLVSNMKKLRSLRNVLTRGKIDEGLSFLSNELRYLEWNTYPASPFPESFQPRKLAILRMKESLQKELWNGYKCLPYLKELKLDHATKLVRTPDFGGLPCLQKLELIACWSLEEIHESLGNHSSLVSVEVRSCSKVTRFPTIVKMEKLKNLRIESSLENVGIELLASSVTSLISLQLGCCGKLKSFNGKFLQALRKLHLSNCKLKDGDIQRFEIGELSNLQELDLSSNEFTRLDFSLSRLTRLKVLSLSHCSNLIELPELPSSLAILEAESCESLEGVIRDEIHTNCKCLSQVSITRGKSGKMENIKGGERLLETMFQGNGSVERRCMSLTLSGFEIARGYEPGLVRGQKCKMQLPENWFNDFSGFLFCTTFDRCYDPHMKIIMKQVVDEEEEETGGWMGMGDSQHNDDAIYWEEDENGGWMGMGDSQHNDSVIYWKRKMTWVGYIPFSLLRHTLWWDPTSTALQTQIKSCYHDSHVIRGCGLKLVPKRGQPETSTTTHSSSEISLDNNDDYKCRFNIHHDSKLAFECLMVFRSVRSSY